MSKLKKILEISEKAESLKIEIWTKSFKVEGVLCECEKFEKGIVTLKDASVSSLLGICKCEGDCDCKDAKYEWFNIFEDHVIAFTIIK